MASQGFSKPTRVVDLAAWYAALPEGEAKAEAGQGAFGQTNLRLIELRSGNQVLGFVTYAFDPGGAYWHFAWVASDTRRNGIARSLFHALLADLDSEWSHGEPAIVWALGKSAAGCALLDALGFKSVGNNTFQFHHRGDAA